MPFPRLEILATQISLWRREDRVDRCHGVPPKRAQKCEIDSCRALPPGPQEPASGTTAHIADYRSQCSLHITWPVASLRPAIAPLLPFSPPPLLPLPLPVSLGPSLLPLEKFEGIQPCRMLSLASRHRERTDCSLQASFPGTIPSKRRDEPCRAHACTGTGKHARAACVVAVAGLVRARFVQRLEFPALQQPGGPLPCLGACKRGGGGGGGEDLTPGVQRKSAM